MAVSSFTYEARDKVGNTVTGQMQAEDRDVVARYLRDQGCVIIRITEQTTAPAPAAAARAPRLGVRVKVDHASLAQFYRQFATIIGAGMTVIQALHTLDEHVTNPTLRSALRGVRPGIERGQRLSENMKRFPEAFSPLAVAVVAAGEHGGRLEEMLKTLAEYAERDLELKRMIDRETLYPKILGFALLTIVPFGLAIAYGITHGAAAGLGMVGLILLAYALLLVAPYFLVRALIRAYGGSQQGRLGIDRMKLGVPVFGSLLNRIAMSRFCRALAALYSAGVALPEGVRLAGDTTGNAALAGALGNTIPHLQKGGKLSDALTASGLIPNLVTSMVRTGEETGNMDQTLVKVADYYDDETKTKLHQLSVTIVPICVVIAGLIVLVIAALFFINFYGGMLKAANG